MSSNDPPLSEAAARRPLARAVELDAQVGSAASLEELRVAALEAGISAAAFDAAAAERTARTVVTPPRTLWRILRQNLLAAGAFWLTLELAVRPAIWVNAAAPVRTLGELLAMAAGIRIADRLDAKFVRNFLIALGAGQGVLFVFHLAGIQAAGANVLTWAVTFTGFVATLAASYFSKSREPSRSRPVGPVALPAPATEEAEAQESKPGRLLLHVPTGLSVVRAG